MQCNARKAQIQEPLEVPGVGTGACRHLGGPPPAGIHLMWAASIVVHELVEPSKRVRILLSSRRHLSSLRLGSAGLNVSAST
jgi:hypothetical protein